MHHDGDCPGAATRFPHAPPEPDMTEKRLGDPVRSRVKVADFAIVAGDVDWPGEAGPQRRDAIGLHRLGRLALEKEITHASLSFQDAVARARRLGSRAALLLQPLHPVFLIVEYRRGKRIFS